MAVLVIGELKGGTAAMNQRLRENSELTAPPEGFIAGFAGPTQDGYRVILVWESEEGFQRYWREILVPGFERLGMTHPTFQVSPLDGYDIAPTAAAGAAR